MKSELRVLLEGKRFEEIADVAARRKRTLGALVSLTYDADPLLRGAPRDVAPVLDRVAGSLGDGDFHRASIEELLG